MNVDKREIAWSEADQKNIDLWRKRIKIERRRNEFQIGRGN